ncbi:MAG: nicotinate (nicotinamide) nucleotide adenylyltransferase [Crenarchaeota archaeon]|nr:MAG: nicotinate (nicotinamide) nucleotide adenylyltransferase [Thermoproteota archaeon]
MKEVVVFGISANPIHLGHVAIAKELTKYKDEVWLSPCFSHMHNKEMAEPYDRLEMCELAAKDIPNVKVCPIEIEQRWSMPTYEYLNKLKEVFEDICFSFAIGQDNADNIDNWKHYKKLISEFSLIVIPRISNSQEGKDWYRHAPHMFLDNFIPLDISSTNVRENLEKNKDMLSSEVYAYIKENFLYG